MTRPATRIRPAEPEAAGRRTGPGRAGALAGRVLGLLVVVATCWGALLLSVPAPSGDPVLLTAAPAADEVVKSPDEVRLTFDRPVPAGLATVHMADPYGEQVVAGRPYNPPGAADVVAVPMPPTRFAGTWSVAWSLPSSRLEPIGATYTFDVSAPSKPTAVAVTATEHDPVVAALHSVARLAATTALAIGVGVTAVLVLVWPAGAQRPPVRRAIGYAWWALVVASIVTFVTFGGYAARTTLVEMADPALLRATFGSDIGAGLLARLIVLVPVTVGLVALLAGGTAEAAGRRWWRAGTVLACGAALAAASSFARPQDPAGPTPVEVGADVALLLSIAVAVGGPVLLWLLQRSTQGDKELLTVVSRSAYVMAASGALLLVVAAVTTNGWQLVALLVLGVLVVGAGVACRWWVRRSGRTRGKDLPGRARFRRGAAVAAAAATVALLVAAALATATGQTVLALPGWVTEADEQPGDHAPGTW